MALWSFQVYHTLRHSAAWLARRDRQGAAPPSADFGLALLREGQAVARLLGLEPGGEKLAKGGRLTAQPTLPVPDPEAREEARLARSA